MPEKRKSDTEPDHVLGSPSGPQYGHVDEAAGGADSSPFETVPAGEQSDAAEELTEQVPDGKRMEQ